MKKLTLPLSALLVGYFRFDPTDEGGNIYNPKQGIKVGDFDLKITHVYSLIGDRYDVWYSDGSHTKFGKDEVIFGITID